MAEPILHNAFVLNFDTGCPLSADPLAVDGKTLMAKLADKGMIAFSLKWNDAFEAQLAIEDDVLFICEAVVGLSELAEGDGVHYVHLGDGELEIMSSLREGVVSVVVERTPHLNERFRRRHEFEIELSRYVAAWHSLVVELQKISCS